MALMTADKKASAKKYANLSLNRQLCFPLYSLSKEVTRLYRRPLKELGLTYTQYIVMLAFWEFGTMSETQLGEKVRLDSGTLTPLLKRLEDQGLLTRTRTLNDERKLSLELTEKGEALKEKALNVPETMRSCVKLSDEELGQLKMLLDKALKNMEE